MCVGPKPWVSCPVIVICPFLWSIDPSRSQKPESCPFCPGKSWFFLPQKFCHLAPKTSAAEISASCNAGALEVDVSACAPGCQDLFDAGAIGMGIWWDSVGGFIGAAVPQLVKAKVAPVTPITWIYRLYIELVNGLTKPIYTLGGTTL